MFGFFNRKADPSQVTPEDVQSRQAAGEKLFILDVREPAEYAEGHIAGSHNIPLGHLRQHLADIPVDRQTIVHGQSGGRSPIAASLLQAQGRAAVIEMKDGMSGWQANQYPFER